MIDQIDTTLVRWINSVLPTQFASPPLQIQSQLNQNDKRVQIVLMDVRPVPMARGVQKPDLQIQCSYLVVAPLGTPGESHKVLGLLMLAAMDAPELEGNRLDLCVEPSSPSAQWWAASGIVPQPSITLVLCDRQSRAVPLSSPVTKPMEIKPASMGVLEGLVLGFNSIPVQDARIKIPPFPAIYKTDRSGRFKTARVPLTDNGTLVEIRARGLVKQTTVKSGESSTIVFETLGQPRDKQPTGAV